MSVHHLSAAVLTGAAGLARPAVAYVSAEPAAVDAYTLTAGRLAGSVAALVALAGVVVGGLALARSARGAGTGRRGGMVALTAGLVGMAIGGIVVAAADGGPGTGYGIVGGFVALAIGLVAVALGWLATARSRRTA
ncbi:DUF6223 family protein [Micromonospora globbae]|jgi:hypothetical protein|uniref:DUF6223 family protein n=1 Tax=Micromonospora globbae TaxID=1894969 RepID=A0A420F8P8_9ACTN|nr:DUF6223 family protein [Micromonospora globbae]RKF29266.1 hypothetical protein D7I43_01475 [Micromonospora globbae]WTF84337.1 DUF6223 family protein [Micromonospora globbae]